MPQTGTVYLLPVPITTDATDTLSPQIGRCIRSLSFFFVENIRTARRFIKDICPDTEIDKITFEAIDKHSGANKDLFKHLLQSGYDIGIMSEAGCPGIADPGADLVAEAQQMNVRIIPLVGPSSLLLALMASGLNGQSFCFRGYLPIREPMRSQKIREFETVARKEKQTQIFIETPYRNNQLLAELLKTCRDDLRVCIAQNLTNKDQFIHTRTVGVWRRDIPSLQKLPTVFLFGV